MTSTEFINQFNSYPEDIKRKVIAYIEQLLSKSGETQRQEQKKVRQPGFGKGTFTYVANDFNAPLDDLKDYM